MPDERARQPDQPVGDAGDIHQIRREQEERHRQQDEGIIRAEHLLEQQDRRQPRLEKEDRQAGEGEGKGHRNPEDDEEEEGAEEERGDKSGGHGALRIF